MFLGKSGFARLRRQIAIAQNPPFRQDKSMLSRMLLLGLLVITTTVRAGELVLTASEKKILELAEKWRPWRAYAALHLWTKHANKL